MYIVNKIRKYLSEYTWDLAFGNDINSVFEKGISKEGLHIIKNPYKSKWFADPFILSREEAQMILLVEEFDSGVNKGRIAKITIDTNKSIITDCKIVLELPTHLSFPAIYRFNDNIYILPENSASGKSVIYQYNTVEDALVKPEVLIEKPLVDPIIKKTKEGYELYATLLGNGGGQELLVYSASDFLGKYVYSHKIKYKDNSARMAGAFISWGDELYRPAQNCNWDYGMGIYLYNKEKRIELKPPFALYEGMHTINTYRDGSFIVDLKRYNFPIIHKVISVVRKVIK